jgi:hypothetical protein
MSKAGKDVFMCVLMYACARSVWSRKLGAQQGRCYQLGVTLYRSTDGEPGERIVNGNNLEHFEVNPWKSGGHAVA